MPTVTAFNAPGVFEPPAYTQAVKVHQAQTLLFLSGQIAYTPDGRAAFRMHHSHDPITIDTCLVAHPLVDDVLQHGRFGAATDQPVVGDWDGDGRTDVGVRTPATRTFRLATAAGVTEVVLGHPRDLPFAGDWDGDGVDEVGVRRAKSNRFVLRAADGTTRVVPVGDVDDLPVTGDWDGDGVTDLGVYDQATATFTLRLVDEDGLTWTASVPWGQAGDLPVTGDWDANGRTDVGVWNPATAVFSKRRATEPTSARATTSTVRFGRAR